MKAIEKKRVLLHICCGVCALYCIQRLKEEGFEVVGFFYNPNIEPEFEYKKRKITAESVAALEAIAFCEGPYDNPSWREICQGYEGEAEGGRRCRLCYEMRLKATTERMQDEGCDCFTTTLSVSPHKESSLICEIGKALAATHFLCLDFKKQDGFRKTLALAKKYNLYQQDYCGCLYSKR